MDESADWQRLYLEARAELKNVRVQKDANATVAAEHRATIATLREALVRANDADDSYERSLIVNEALTTMEVNE